MKVILSLLVGVLFQMLACNTTSNSTTTSTTNPPTVPPKKVTIPTKPTAVKELAVGAAQLDKYLPILKGKKVGLVVNQTSTIGDMHLVDKLIAQKIDVQKVFAPEHGFRGKADAGEQVKNAKDVKTGLPIISLYGKNKKPTVAQIQDLDVLVFDIQDVGARFYTYISTMHYVMEACAENGKKLLILDRPNPNGHYVDGPVLGKSLQSFVGMHPIPIVHGLTMGELAQMINGEKWLKNGVTCAITIIKCEGYTHNYFYQLPIKPSPNLPNNKSIYLYPSLCLFEGTTISVGRGTNKQFQIVGSPAYKSVANMPYQFTPKSQTGAKYPKHENKVCKGIDLSTLSFAELTSPKKINLQWILDFYQAAPDKTAFFNKNNFFEKLAGTKTLREQIKAGKSETAIRASWEPALTKFKDKRKKYLLYPDFN